MDSGRSPVEPLLGVYLIGREAIYVDLYDTANWEIRETMCHFGGEI